MSSGKVRDRLKRDIERCGAMPFMREMKRRFNAELESWQSDELHVARRGGELSEVKDGHTGK